MRALLRLCLKRLEKTECDVLIGRMISRNVMATTAGRSFHASGNRGMQIVLKEK
jgi:hypothetical protein